ncbi:hypothetical protein CcaverHIS002_0310730 [Cutaneotrichosporon cavernicola]|uniref:P-loop containing nucleoside triphosphate hydrolase protein n=1 Tax=Cutaneotrichosporon cavernicola TaxID=279322 RepID=A0AA48QV21_9TREE|nr:uncharacterized protein CcaverHIS019_0310590 [Cutaneotrichosporon cavernicola]BEI83205.1 hypothetical protein CcaverHIS002_0310730 [Cutaneotrichosporon cavernicola]BEI90989.1 hypothetical protein CcaverHIS019_0310590 [Cutaneotrichosporon cavernicola]BEI98767.1 hypothetical protein CcaverHIS631_0310660 [Cutaneotrichosporon cavernicola]BEJ06539.1 hypothetical protein CcaverHIS641_0310610 [Cutaneotrichosporon cavernicola]
MIARRQLARTALAARPRPIPSALATPLVLLHNPTPVRAYANYPPGAFGGGFPPYMGGGGGGMGGGGGGGAGGGGGGYPPFGGRRYPGQPPQQPPQQQGPQKGETLKQFSVDLTEMAKEGKLDPIIGRDEEIRRTIQILSRRTKSNPCLIGLPGVGKTAIIEGLAQRIVNKDVPESMQDKRVLVLDLSLLLAGTGVRGEFESRFKQLLKDIDDEAGSVIIFIDEIHTLLNLGKAEGSMDAGNMIKPALARGLQLIGATTLDEYRKYIEKDPALQRRFQAVMIKEPTVADTISILRGLKSRYEAHFGVQIADSALVTAAVYSDRYVPDRFLPDKAIDLVDEACSTLKLTQESRPQALEDVDRRIMTLEIERESLKNEEDAFSIQRRNKVEDELKEKKEKQTKMKEVWSKERERVQEIKGIKEELEHAKIALENAQRHGDFEVASRLRFSEIPRLQKRLPQAVAELQKEDAANPDLAVRDRVTSEDIAIVVGKATGIPVSNLLKGERERLVNMEGQLKKRVVGQDEVIKVVSNAIRLSRAGLQSPNRPLASFLFLGPTGVGKTELTKAVAEFLFNDEQKALIQINMSEFHDKHTVSRLIGATPGFVGYEEGGQLTEAVRRRPYSVVVFDEIEKAHPDVANILLQILEEGVLTDGQGRQVSFKNTIIALTSNLGAEALYEPGASEPDGTVSASAKNAVLRDVNKFFRPELINRLDELVVFNKLPPSTILDIVNLRLAEVAARLAAKRITLDVTEPAREWLAKKGYSDRYGARAISRVVRDKISNPLALKMLNGEINDGEIVTVHFHHDALEITSKPDPNQVQGRKGSDSDSDSNSVLEEHGELP